MIVSRAWKRGDGISGEPGGFDGILPTRIPQPGPSGLGRSQSGLGALRDCLALVFGDSGKDVNGSACSPWGISAATKSTPLSISPEMKWTLRASRSSLAMTRVAFCRRHVSSAAALDLLELGEQGSAVRESRDGGALGLQSKAALALAVGRNPVIGHKRAHSERLYCVETEVSESTKAPTAPHHAGKLIPNSLLRSRRD